MILTVRTYVSQVVEYIKIGDLKIRSLGMNILSLSFWSF